MSTVWRFADDAQLVVHVWLPISEMKDVDEIAPALVGMACEAWGEVYPAEFEATPPVIALQPDTGRPSWRISLVRDPVQGCPLCEGRGHLKPPTHRDEGGTPPDNHAE